jgi:ankyrin repeat protein
VARFLINHGADVKIQAKEGHTAFDLASIIGDTEVVRILAAVSMKVPGQSSKYPFSRLNYVQCSKLY